MRAILISLLFVFFCLPAQALEAMKPKANLTILTDESMLLPLAQIARAYAKESQTPLTIVVKQADTTQRQIEQGLEAHVLISANYSLIDQLTNQGLTDVSSRKPIARTQLALVTTSDLGQQAGLAKRISFASIIAATPNLPIYVNAPATIEGERAMRLREGFEFSASLQARMEEKPSYDDVITALNDTPSLALMLAAQAVVEPDTRVVSLLPDDISPAVTYDVVVLGSELMGESSAFANYLSTRKTRAIFSQFGYQPPTN